MANDVSPALSLIGVSLGVSTFQSMLPPLPQVRRATPGSDPATTADVRTGECAAAAVTIGVGTIASSLSRSALPIVISLLVSALMITVYEVTLVRYRPMEAKANA